MEAINYLLRRTIINSLKELKKHPIKLISYIAFIALMIFAMINSKNLM